MSQNKQPKVINLTLRDGQQSTLAQEDWVFSPSRFAKVIAASRDAGFSGAEVAGGQSFQISIYAGFNPFTVLNSISHALKCGGDDRFELQMLFRGANALGFRHYDRELVEMTIEEFIKSGITKIRFFDALNDIGNLRLSDRMKSHNEVVLEAALCFAHYKEHPERYSDSYYVSYAKELIKEGYTAIGIKDMSGQLTAARVATLVPALQEVLDPLDVPLSLHCHSTHAKNSREAIQKALELNIAAIETAEGVLAGGSSHHPLEEISSNLIADSDAYELMKREIERTWGGAPDRKDAHIPDDVKEQLCEAGVPGGAMPFVMRDLQQQQATIRAKHKVSVHVDDSVRVEDVHDFGAIVDLFIAELKQVCVDAALPLLVTPTADICCKQAIANLAFGSDPYSGTLAGRYLNSSGQPNPDTRFAKLVLGYYGDLKSYNLETGDYRPDDALIAFFEVNNVSSLKNCIGLESSTPGNDVSEAQKMAWKLIQKLGDSVLSYASFDQLTILYALKPFATMSGEDPIRKAVEIYLERSEQSKIDGSGKTFLGYKNMMQPLLCHMKAMVVFNKEASAKEMMKKPMEDYGEMLCGRMFDIYTDLRIWANVTDLTNHLSKLFSSSHISLHLREAAHYVSESLLQLDLRPIKAAPKSIDEAYAYFKKRSVSEIFSSLALITGFVNDVAKYATNPSIYAERRLNMDDVADFLSNKRQGSVSLWEQKIRQSVVSKNLRLESDFRRRLEGWRT